MPESATSSAVPRRWAAAAVPAVPAGASAAVRRRTVYLVFVLIQVVVGLIAGMLAWLRPFHVPDVLPIHITEYEARQFPVHSQAEPDRVAFVKGNVFPVRLGSAFVQQERHLIVHALAGLKERAVSEAVVVYLGALACTNDRGEVFLLPGDAHPDSLWTRLPLREVLGYLRACPARHKLLILDIMQPTADPRLGVLANDVAGAVHAELQAVEDPDRLVLCACSPGQTALVSEELRRSVFSYFLEEGLIGWADPYNPARRSMGRVSVRELAEFVKLRADRWAVRNHGTRQTPILVGSGADFPLIGLEHDIPREHQGLPDPVGYPPWLLDGWKLRDRWQRESEAPAALGPRQTAPRPAAETRSGPAACRAAMARGAQ